MPQERTSHSGFEVDGVTVRFGGLTAVDDVSLRAEPGSATALIGPNGAGKTTLFNAAVGVVRPSAGSVRLGELCLDDLGTAARAEAGLGRTFQRIALFDSMTVTENVSMGPEMRLAGRQPWTHLRESRRDRTHVRARAADAIRACGLETLGDRVAADLSTGQRRLVELARAIASDFDFLLLDEPSSGLDNAETETFGAILHDLVAAGMGLLVIEHDMTLVRSLCTAIYVLEFGRLIAAGPAATVLDSDAVRAAYLGGDQDDSRSQPCM